MSGQSFSSFKELARLRGDRRLVLFGAGEIANKTLRRLDRAPAFLVDNNPNLWNTQGLGLDIKDPAELAKAGPAGHFALICTTSFLEVGRQLETMGFRPERDFLVSPVLNDLRIIGEIENARADLVFTSGSPPREEAGFGGGIYELTLDGGFEYRKVHSGNCHGILPFEEGYVAVDDARGLIELDRSFRVRREAPLPLGTRGHGIAFSDLTGCFYVVATYLDQVLVFDRDFRPKGSYAVSDKLGQEGAPSHHCNDVCAVGNSLYVSMFSLTGNWKRDVFDGVVLEMDIHTGRHRGPVLRDLWMPHNIGLVEGSLTVLDSLRGELKRNNGQAVGRFPGFSRGLAHDGNLWYVGQSRNRNYSKFIGLSLNISIDASIIVFDDATKVSRSLALPHQLSEIHAITLKRA